MTFKKVREQEFKERKMVFQEFEDDITGAKHFHLDMSEGIDNSFAVAFATQPETDDGRAHILEHLVLCGSKNYPIKDPFFAMDGRSLSSYKNALTAHDYTMYPFATHDEKDYFNLMDIYLDAVFYPNLTELDFRQEGWRYEIKPGSTEESPELTYQGVVFNEMKGAFSSQARVFKNEVANAIRPTLNYKESGGNPLSIPDLSYEELKAFHQTYYHPSRAVFVTTGKIDVNKIQKEIEEKVLSGCSVRLPKILPAMAPSATGGVSKKLPYFSKSTSGHDHIVKMVWASDEEVTAEKTIEMQLLCKILLNGSFSPLVLNIRDQNLGQVSYSIGTDRQPALHINVSGATEENVPKVKQIMLEALETLATQGIPEAQLKVLMRDVEYELQSQANNEKGLNLCLGSIIPAHMMDRDVLTELDTQPMVSRVCEKMKDPEFVKGLFKTLIESSHRIDIHGYPDTLALQASEQIEKERLLQKQASLSPQEWRQIKEQSEALAVYQEKEEDLSCLPMIAPSDVEPLTYSGPEIIFKKGEEGPSLVSAAIPTPGTANGRITFELTNLPQSEWEWVHLYGAIRSELGTGDLDYLSSRRQNREKAYEISCKPASSGRDNGRVSMSVGFEVKGLKREIPQFCEQLEHFIKNPRLNEDEQLAKIIERHYKSEQTSWGGRAEDFANYKLGAYLSASASENEKGYGYSSFNDTHQLYIKTRTPEGIAEVWEKLKQVHEFILNAPMCIGSFGLQEDIDQVYQELSERFKGSAATQDLLRAETPYEGEKSEIAFDAFHTTTLVNSCKMVMEAPDAAHPDAGILMVMTQLMDQYYLHTAVREKGGAYGSGCRYQPTGYVQWDSHRDPRLKGTFDDFEASLKWVKTHPHSRQELDEAILAILADLEGPETPAQAANYRLRRIQLGITEEIMTERRKKILGCTVEDIRRCVDTHFTNAPKSITAVVGDAGLVEAKSMGMNIIEIKDPFKTLNLPTTEEIHLKVQEEQQLKKALRDEEVKLAEEQTQLETASTLKSVAKAA